MVEVGVVRCAKPCCSDEATARLTYDHGERTAWLGPLGPHGGWPLCARHAQTFRVPLGWTCIDARPVHQPVLVPAQGSAPAPVAARAGSLAPRRLAS